MNRTERTPSVGYRRFAVIKRDQIVAVMTRNLRVTYLSGCPAEMSLARSNAVCSRRPRRYSTVAAVEADAAAVDASAKDGPVVVNVSDDGLVHVRKRSVIGEGVASPDSADESRPEEAEPVVDSAVKADRRTPESRRPRENAQRRRPVARSPVKPNRGWCHPGSGDPRVSVLAPRPIPRRPHRVGGGCRRLFLIGRQRRRRRSDRGAHAGIVILRESERRHRREGQCDEERLNRTEAWHLLSFARSIQSKNALGFQGLCDTCPSRRPA